jgi:hypothetical protein
VSALDEDSERSHELAGWLVEAGKRRCIGRAPECVKGLVEDPSRQSRPSGLPRMLLLGVLAVACLQYVYLDALLEIASLRQLIVFVLAGANG